ncbi:hypothetical protein HanRHA438_Chr16g0777071 [Helianthus annuus]|nr:hypothetical protein HanRHA438_Chr16g0777071 [Helianthus annuus]
MASFDAPLIRKPMEGCVVLEHLYQMRPKFEVIGFNIRCVDSGAKVTYGGS